MKKMGLITMGVAALLLACATVSTYPIHLRYVPEKEPPQVSTELRGKVITVTTFGDNRGVADLRTIGTRVDSEGKETPFVSSREAPSANVTKAFKTYLFKKGYTVRGETPGWGLDSQTISPEWGGWVIGGSLEELSVEVKSYVRTFYECKLKLRVVVADVKEKKVRYNQTIELSSSYKTVTFRLKTAERMINKLLAEAIERTLVDLEKG
ncbi:MAG: hypothetical protein JRI46_01920 [Deltaproteobacteria bacterium]|nr:hypothetical protein [Deltaproteobacteria bacterium]